MDTKRIALLGGLVVLGGFMFIQMQKLGNQPPQVIVKEAAPAQPVVQEIEMAHVLVPNQPINRGQRVKPEMLEWRKWPMDAVGPTFIEQDMQPNAIEDWTNAVAYIDIAQGEPLTARKMVKPGDKSVMSAFLSPGTRAVSIRISTDAASSGFIAPGDRVDIMLTRRLRGPGQPADAYATQTIFENVKVLSIDQVYSKGPDGAPYVLGGQAMFEMNREDAELLTSAQPSGDISLILRPMSGADRPGVKSHALVEGDKEEVTGQVKLYRGGQTEIVMLGGQ